MGDDQDCAPSTLDLAAARPDVAVDALHPGALLDTNMVRETFGHSWGSPESGADVILDVVERALSGVTGQYFEEHEPARADEQAYDIRARAELRALTDRMLAPWRSEAAASRPSPP